jgi:hypothetical protein
MKNIRSLKDQLNYLKHRNQLLHSIGKSLGCAVFALLILTAVNINIFAQLPGTVDPNFTAGVMSPYTLDYAPQVQALGIQPDGKHIIAGSFKAVNSIGRNYIARLNEDGTTDETFSTGVGFNVFVKAVAVQPDGKILVGGRFNTFTDLTGTVNTRWKVARLN